MGVRDNLKRVMISIPSSQAQWLEGFCKNHHITKSKYISYMLAKKAEELILILKIKDAQGAWMTEEKLKELIEIVKTPWIDN